MSTFSDLDKLEAQLRQQLASIRKARKDARNWRKDPQLKEIADSIVAFSNSSGRSIRAIKRALFSLLPAESRRPRPDRVRTDGFSMPQLRSMAKAKGLRMPNTSKVSDFKKALGL